MRQSITVAIVTRNRAEILRECLHSLTLQTLRPKNILIIDNNSADNTHGVILSFSGELRIREVKENAIGYPTVYNRALKEVKTSWIVFIDDDCVADKHWFHHVVDSVRRHPHATAILGPSYNYYPRNVFACAFQFSNEWWRLRSIKGEEIINYAVLDSRNIIYNNTLLKKYSIKFDETFLNGAEDSDLGLQITRKGLTAIYDRHMIVCHREPVTYKDYRYKKLRYLVSGFDIRKKWGLVIKFSETPHYYLKTTRLFKNSVKQLSFCRSLQCFLIIIIDLIYTKITRHR
jgi:GT2 family glycosyltransferase